MSDTDMKVLFFDIETSLAQVYTYGLYDQNISIANVIEHPRMIAFTAKWLGKPKMFAYSEYHQSRTEMLKAMHELLDEADLVIGWNSKNFDVKWVNSEFMVENMLPPSPYKQLDLMQEVKRNARFLSNKLDYISERLLNDKKIEYNMARMWIKVNNPETTEAERKKEWNAMLKYAKKDTALLEPMFNDLLPWLRLPHPVQQGEDKCRNCGSHELKRRGVASTLNGTYQRYQCRSCGAWSRGTLRTPTTNMRNIV